jgi:methylated-DNA-[protein]-cysteine S-methyltransferase
VRLSRFGTPWRLQAVSNRKDFPIATITHLTRIGWLRISSSDAGICRIAFTDSDVAEPAPSNRLATERVQAASSEIDEYLAGSRTEFSVLVDLAGVSSFDRQVLSTLANRIRYGDTASYGELTSWIGRGPADARKVGSALSRNPLPILLPCHRVVGADGSLTGYAGGLAAKQALLDLEAGCTRLSINTSRACSSPCDEQGP